MKVHAATIKIRWPCFFIFEEKPLEYGKRVGLGSCLSIRFDTKCVLGLLSWGFQNFKPIPGTGHTLDEPCVVDVCMDIKQNICLGFGGPPDLLRAALPGPGIEPPPPGRERGPPAIPPGSTQNRRTTNKSTKTPPRRPARLCMRIFLGPSVPKTWVYSGTSRSWVYLGREIYSWVLTWTSNKHV